MDKFILLQISEANHELFMSFRQNLVFSYLQVTLMGIGAFLGGMMTLTPECLQPRMAPPRASTMKLTRNLMYMVHRLEENINLQRDPFN